ncbi:hypothetical protein [Candidiatus Paracoxiella cheracis]|uniref:hypothetical protein n=1 Tax=Candidiatus Paracoxiella cheracis TaxID=3405120 RepID=UPI003BF4BFEF
MTARKDFLQSLTLGKKSEPTAEYAPSLRSPWRASRVISMDSSGGLLQSLKCFFKCTWLRALKRSL